MRQPENSRILARTSPKNPPRPLPMVSSPVGLAEINSIFIFLLPPIFKLPYFSFFFKISLSSSCKDFSDSQKLINPGAATSIFSKNPLDRYSVANGIDDLARGYDQKQPDDLMAKTLGRYDLKGSTDPKLDKLSNGIDLLGVLSAISALYAKK